jgi:hypothetical protein
MPGGWSIVPRADNELVTADIYNGDRQDIVNHIEPLYVDDYSATVAQMQAETNPGAPGAEALAVSLAGELERIRYVLHHVLDPTGPTWYSALQSKIGAEPVHNVKTYGATGDGITDDTGAIQQALNEAGGAAGRAVVVLPRGSYKISAITIPTGVTVRGAGWVKTHLVSTATSGGAVVVGADAQNVRVEALTIRGPAAAQPGLTALYVSTGSALRVTDVHATQAEYGVLCGGMSGLVLDRVRTSSTRIGIQLSGNTQLAELRGCGAESADLHGYLLATVSSITLVGCWTSDTGRTVDASPLQIQSGADVAVVNFMAFNPAAKAAPAITADAASARVAVLNCRRINIGPVAIGASQQPWALLDGRVESPWALRAWGTFTSTGATVVQAGIASVVKGVTGEYRVTWARPFASANYTVGVSATNSTGATIATTFGRTADAVTVVLRQAISGVPQATDTEWSIQAAGYVAGTGY